jgi:uncharacterized RDD family membrane protein YckC
VAPLNAPAPTAHRIASWGWDYLLILGWLLLVFLVVGLPQILGWIDLTPVWTNQTSADIGTTILTVLPYFAYLYLSESREPHATWGKRRAGLAVTDAEGASLKNTAVLIRNVVKVMPWQLGHMGTMRLVTASEITTTAIVLQVGSLTLLALIVVPILLRGRGAHDVIAGTQVVSTTMTGNLGQVHDVVS